MLSTFDDLEIVCQAASGAEAVSLWKVHKPDVGLIDLRMPDLDGTRVIQAIRQADCSARLMVMTTLCGDEDVFQALHAGATGYMLKDCNAERMVDGIRAVLRGQRFLDSSASASLAARVVHAHLTPRELEVLRFIAQGLSNKRIARHLDVAEGTIKTHVKSLLDKLGCENRTEAIRIGVSRGLVRSSETSI